MSLGDTTIKKAVTAAMIAAALASGVFISLAHYDTFALRFVMFAWTVWPYPAIWFFSTRPKRRSTRLFWSGYAAIGFLAALLFYVVPWVIHAPWLSVGMVMAPGYLLNIGIISFVVFITVRGIVGARSPNQLSEPTPPRRDGSS